MYWLAPLASSPPGLRPMVIVKAKEKTETNQSDSQWRRLISRLPEGRND